MFDVLATIVVKAVESVVGEAISRGANNLSTRRQILARLLQLYDSLDELTRCSTAVLREFELYAQGKDTITKTIPAERLQKLASLYRSYSGRLKKVTRLLEIYDNETAVMLIGAKTLKAHFWRSIDLTDEITPRMERTEAGATFELSFPSELPSVVGRTENYPLLTDEGLEAKAPLIRKEILDAFRRVQFDLRDSGELAGAIERGLAATQRIEEARRRLATLIRESFPLSSLTE